MEYSQWPQLTTILVLRGHTYTIPGSGIIGIGTFPMGEEN